MTREGRLLCLEAGRGIAALIVVVRHVCVHAFEGEPRIVFIPVPSATAVMFFFVLSGTVMGLTQDRDAGWRSALSFLMHRAFRVYPLYWLMALTLLAVWPMFIRPGLLAFQLLLMPAALTESELLSREILPPVWTLHWELFFYGMFAVAILTGRSRLLFATWAAAMLLTAVPSVRSWLGDQPGGIVALITGPLGLLFVTGVAVAALVRRIRWSVRQGVALAACGGALTLWSVRHGVVGVFLPETTGVMLVSAFGLGALLLGLIVLERAGRLPVGRWCLVLGRLSYPLYVSHWLVIELTKRELFYAGWDMRGNAGAYAGILLASCLAGGAIVTFLIDRPLQRAFRILLSPPRVLSAPPAT